MRKSYRLLAMLLSFLCVFSLLAGLSVSASAGNYGDEDYMIWGGALEYPWPGRVNFDHAENISRITPPKSSSYTDNFQLRYVDAPKGHSIYVFNAPDGGSNHRDVVYHGQRVLRIAKQNGFSCVLFYTKANKLHVGWVSSSHLTKDYPGRVTQIGQGYSSGDFDAFITWSSRVFPGTKQHYAVLSSPVEECKGFTLDYHVTDRNGASTKQVLGDRTVFVYDGHNWNEVGSFRYNALGPVHVKIKFDKPMDLEAVAVTADCAKPNTFDFRMSVLDIY